MSAEGEQQRKPGAPDDTEGRRRLRTVSYPDPFLVTKLPLEGTVNSGVIRLGERMLLGFIHRPFPDGTPVRVVYDEWLFAERIDEPEAEQEEDGAGEKRPARGKKSGGSKGRSKNTAGSRSAGGSKNSGANAKADDAKGAQPTNEQAPVRAGENGSRGAAEGGASSGESEGRSFPDEFIDPESRTNRELDSRGDAWTDTFTRRNEEE